MPYIEGRVAHDADAHVMEIPGWLRDHADPGVRDRLPEVNLATTKPGENAWIDRARARQSDPAYRARDEQEIMLRKNWDAVGAFVPDDRPRALDLLGVSSQLVFNTFHNSYFSRFEHKGEIDLVYGAARAHNRAMVAFCAVDRRLLPTGYVPLADFDRARDMAREALDIGCRALLVPSRCPRGHSPSHTGLFPVWEQAQEAGVPIVFHVGGGAPLLSPDYFENGLPAIPDFHGGDENFRSVDYMAIPHPPMLTLAALIFDGILDRFPRLKFGVIEQGAAWVPGFMRQLDSAHDAFRKNEERLQKLSLRASDYVRRQVRVTPYPSEDLAWIIAQAGEEVCLFSTDYPHVEGGRNPVKRFEAGLSQLSPRAADRFYCDNFVDLMGPALG